MEYAILSQCDTEIEALNIKETLAANGIESIIEAAEIYDTISVQVAGKRTIYVVKVDNSEIVKAKSIVAKLEQEQKEQLPWCPNCGEDNVEKVGQVHHSIGPKWLICVCIFLFVLSIVLTIIHPLYVFVPGLFWVLAFIFSLRGYDEAHYHCKECNHDWWQMA